MNTNLSRRRLAAVVLGASTLPLFAGACASTDKAKIEQAEKMLKLVVKNAKILANGLKSVAAQLASLNIPGMTPAVMAVVNVSIDGVVKVSTDIESVTSLAAAQPLVAKISTYVQTVVNSLATLPLPDDVVKGLRAVSIVLPFLEMAVDLVVTNAPDTSMSFEEAQKILAG